MKFFIINLVTIFSLNSFVNAQDSTDYRILELRSDNYRIFDLRSVDSSIVAEFNNILPKYEIINLDNSLELLKLLENVLRPILVELDEYNSTNLIPFSFSSNHDYAFQFIFFSKKNSNERFVFVNVFDRSIFNEWSEKFKIVVGSFTSSRCLGLIPI